MGGRSQVVVEEGERLFFFRSCVFVFGRGKNEKAALATVGKIFDR